MIGTSPQDFIAVPVACGAAGKHDRPAGAQTGIEPCLALA